MSISSNPWGKVDGEPVCLYTLRDEIIVKISNYGGTIVSVQAPDQAGKMDDIVLGFDDLEGYLSSGFYHGATIGRYANRIGSGGFTLDGIKFDLPLNDGSNSLHGGFKGFDKRVWGVEVIDDVSLKFNLVSPDGEEGYPGTLKASVVFTVIGARLEVDYFASTDKPTVVNLTNHAYFNLGGSESILDHELWVDADHYTPVNNELIPTGVLEPVDDTPFDFREPTKIGSRIEDDHPQLALGNGYDHNYVLNQVKNPQIAVTEPTSGRVLEISTTMPGVQFYTGNFLDGKEIGRDGPIGFREGFCLETQFYPDSPNKPVFPSPVLRPGKKYIEKTVYRFSVVN
jgi:aldose 1-epimerase